MNYIKIIRDLREDNDLPPQQIAGILSTSQTMYARYERGANELLIHHLVKLCEFYDVSSDYILGVTDKNNTRLKFKRVFYFTYFQLFIQLQTLFCFP